jgi:hypothetical protein
MPFTPLHMGPGLAFKAVGGRHFSLMMFGFSQVMMDLEPLIRMIRGDSVLHGVTHTYLGATAIGLASVLIGKPFCQWLLDRVRPDASLGMLTWMRGSGRSTSTSAIVGAFFGTYSHVALDSVMHADMQPLAPFSNDNALLRIVAVDAVHASCIAAGVIGVTALTAAYLAARRQHLKVNAREYSDQLRVRALK